METQNKRKSTDVSSASAFIIQKSKQYLSTLLPILNSRIDKRLVDTFFNLFIGIQTFREQTKALLLSELGAYISSPSQAPAGTKKISNLLRCKKWDSTLIDNFFFEKTKQRIAAFKEQGKRALFLWDDSRVEKPESWFSEGLCSVSSSKAARKMRIKPGYYNPPAKRVCVPGYHWTGILVSALGAIPSVCHMSWWTTRGKFKEDGENIMYRMLKKCKAEFGNLVTHILDRGYANARIIEWMIEVFQQDFIIRWKSSHNLINEAGIMKKTHLISRSYRAMDSRLVQDKERKKYKNITIAFAKVFHPDYPEKELSLVIVRDKNNYNSPMYLLTSIEVQNVETAWEICFSYIHRWHIEQAFRFAKSELGIESARLWFFQNRLKLFAIVALVYDFLLSLIRNWSAWIPLFLKIWAHRTGNRYKEAFIPIYRLRIAIMWCLLWYHVAKNSG